MRKLRQSDLHVTCAPFNYSLNIISVYSPQWVFVRNHNIPSIQSPQTRVREQRQNS